MVLSQNKCFNSNSPPALAHFWRGKKPLAFSLSHILILKSWQVCTALIEKVMGGG